MVTDLVCRNILGANNISKFNLLNIMNDFFKNVQYGDIFLQDCNKELFTLENNKFIENFFSSNCGVGVRSILDNKIGFSNNNNISLNSIINSIKESQSILDSNNNFICKNYNFDNNIKRKYVYNFISPINIKNSKSKIDFLFYLNNYIKKKDKRINYISLKLLSIFEYILVVSTDNIFVGDVRPLISLFIKIHIEDNNKTGIGYSGYGGRYSYDKFLSLDVNFSLVKYYANLAFNMAFNNLHANYPPAMEMPVVLGPGCTGILLHEAVGHGLEGDFNRKNISLFKDCMNKKVASELCTVVDNGSLNEYRGSLNIDDEGVLVKKNILIKNGILVSYMLDKFNANLMKLKTTGNARRESYSCLPIPRMTNTYLLSGESSFEDIINSVDYGIYITSLGSGQVDITSGNFVFFILESFLIKNGKITNPLKGVTLIGSSIDVMNKIIMIGNDLKFDSGIGTCFKDGQGVPVCVGQPTVKISSMIVGGVN